MSYYKQLAKTESELTYLAFRKVYLTFLEILINDIEAGKVEAIKQYEQLEEAMRLVENSRR